MKAVTVHSHANIALIKYWGKRDETLFLPTKNSISITVSKLKTITTIGLSNKNKDIISFDWKSSVKKSTEKITRLLDIFRKNYNIDAHFTIQTQNEFPTGAGLASSSSGFSALAVGLDALCNLKLSKKEISMLARQGSGSACRSVYGGFVQWHKGTKPDGSDSFAEQLFSEKHWPELRILIAVIKEEEKPISSREGMLQTVATSPFYKQWLLESEQRIPMMIAALEKKDLTLVGELAEHDWYGMRQTMLTTKPPLDYCITATHNVINTVKELRKKNIQSYYTTDAGPNVKILCLENNIEKIKSNLKNFPGIIKLLECRVAQDPIVITNE